MGSSVAGCDRTYEYGGSHAVEMEYYARVSVLGENFHPVYQSMARMMAMGRSNIFFNKSPIKQKNVLLLAQQNGSAILFADQRQISRTLPSQEGVLKRSSFGAAWITPTQVFAIDPYKTSTGVFAKDDYSYFKLLNQDRGQGQDLIDQEEADLGPKRHFLILNSKSQVSSYEFPAGKWRPYRTTPMKDLKIKTTGPDGTQAVLLVARTGEAYSIDPENLSQTTKLPWVWPSDYSQFAVQDSKVLGLNNSGQVDLIEKGVSKGAFPALQGQKFEQMVSIPLYDAFEVQN